MSIFAKRKTLLQNMAFMGIMAAINIIISVISAFSPIASVILVIFLPLTSTLVELFCESKYYSIYAVATFGLGIVATLWNMQTTFFTLLPSLVTGFIFGLFAKHKVNSFWSIFISAIFQAAITLLFIPLINFIFSVDIVLTFKTAFGLKDSTTIDTIIPAFVLAVSFVQIILSYIAISQEIRKFREEMNYESDDFMLFGIIGSIVSASLIGLYFASLEVAYAVLIIAIYFASYILMLFIKHKMWMTLILCGMFLLLNVFIYALGYSNLKENSALLLVGITPFCISTLSLVVSFLKKKPE